MAEHEENSKDEEPKVDESRLTKGGRVKKLMPKKTLYRMRAHINPLSAPNFPVPFKPSYVDWSVHFPKAYGIDNNNDGKICLNTPQFPITYDKDLADTPLY